MLEKVAGERFIAAAVAPLEDNAELQIAARHQLQELLSGNPDPSHGSDSLETCASRIEALPPAKPLYRRLLVPLMAITAIAIATFTVWQIHRHRDILSILDADFFFNDAVPESVIAPRATAPQRLLLFGDSSPEDEAARWKALWQRNPDDPCYFDNYARIHLNKKKDLPPDYLQTVRRIDPDNGYFLMLEAAALAEDCVEDVTPKRKKGDPPKIPKWSVKDQGRLDRIGELLLDAAAQPQWQSYHHELIRRQFAALPTPADSLERLSIGDYLGRKPATGFHPQLVEAIGALAEQKAIQGDTAGYKKLLESWTKFAPLWSGDRPPGLMESLIGSSLISGCIPNFQGAAAELGMTAEAEKLSVLREAWSDLRSEDRKNDPQLLAEKAMLEQHGSFRLALSAAALNLLPSDRATIGHEALVPGRNADFELAYRAGALAAFAIFGIAALLVALYRFRGGLLARRLSLPLSALLQRADLMWIIGGGVLFPFLGWQLLSRFTPLGVKHWGTAMHGMFVPAGQLLATTILMLALPVLIARWRLRLRAGAVLPAPRRAWIAAIFVAAGILAIPTFWIAFQANAPRGLFDEDEIASNMAFIDLDITATERPAKGLLYTATGLVVLVLLWWLTAAVRALASSRERILHRITMSRVLTLSYSCAMLLAALSLPLFHAAEKHWVAQDTLCKFTADTAPADVFEAHVSAAFRKRYLDLFENTLR